MKLIGSGEDYHVTRSSNPQTENPEHAREATLQGQGSLCIVSSAKSHSVLDVVAVAAVVAVLAEAVLRLTVARHQQPQ